MKNRTYRYYTGNPLYAFGHGLSYTKFEYEGLELSSVETKPDETVRVKCKVSNTGRHGGDEVVQIYASPVEVPVSMPLRQLVGFSRIPIKAGETETVEIDVPRRQASPLGQFQGRLCR